eukprot:TRINITY_DN22263_c0_g1_i1.p2 TRINITY_DN22263_c0_g1~~TRINITY_DN22263_c0_g1_i1.p2  ORF type:complete len:130 (+),score=31.91 TRINITY_DN22263_c0_g1_i1:124-513(+)
MFVHYRDPSGEMCYAAVKQFALDTGCCYWTCGYWADGIIGHFDKDGDGCLSEQELMSHIPKHPPGRRLAAPGYDGAVPHWGFPALAALAAVVAGLAYASRGAAPERMQRCATYGAVAGGGEDGDGGAVA